MEDFPSAPEEKEGLP